MNILDYIKGNRRGKEANRLEREAMSDPFLDDALEGFESVSGNHEEIVSRLRDRITVRSRGRRRRNVRTWTAVAAVGLLFLTVGGVYWGWQQRPDMPPQVADVQEPDVLSAEFISDSTTRIAQAAEVRQQAEIQEDTAAPELEEQTMRVTADIINIVADDAKIDTQLSFSDFDQETEMVFIPEPARERVQEETLDEMVIVPSSGQKIMAESTPSALQDSAIEVDRSGSAVASGVQARRSASGTVTEMEESALAELTENQKAWQRHLERNQARQFDEAGEPIRGKVVVEFRVNRQGRPQNIRIIESLTPGSDREALRLLATGPDWDRTDGRTQITIEFK